MNANQTHEPWPSFPPQPHHSSVRVPSTPERKWVAALSGGDATNSDRSSPDAHQPALHAGPIRVLVVDDNVDAADTLTEALEMLGYDVRTAYEAESALTLARELQPDVGILDIGLPGMDGYALAGALHALPRSEAMPIVALTGYGQPGDRQRALDAGFAEHLVKPASLDVILATIARLRGG